MKEFLIMFVAALVLGSVVNGMQSPTTGSQQAQLMQSQAQDADDSAEPMGAGSLNTAPVVVAPLESANDSSFQSQVLSQNVPVLVDFYTQTCPHCKNMEPVLGRLASDYSSKLKIVKVDVMESPSVALKYDVGSVPAFVLFDQGKPVTTFVGEMPKRSIVALIKPYLNHPDAEDAGKIQIPPASTNQSG